MNNPDNIPIDVEEQRDWLNAHKAATSLSWGELAQRSGVPSGTLSTFATGKYLGRNDEKAKQIFRYRQLLESQAERQIGMIVAPAYFETESSRRIRGLMSLAQTGCITVVAMGPGTGKTLTAVEYAGSVANCWRAEMRKSKKTISQMTLQVLRALTIPTQHSWMIGGSDMVVNAMLKRPGALIIIDEANHLTNDSLEEIRGWHDATGVGICLLGNEELLMRIRGGPRSDALARLNSRIAASHIQNLPYPGDVEAFCDAWGVTDPAMRAMLSRVALTPAAGGLRECRQLIQQASLIAADDERAIALSDLRDVQSTRATRHIV